MFVIDSMYSESYVCSEATSKQGCVDISCTADHRVEESLFMKDHIWLHRHYTLMISFL
jgi:hypothetical protein